MPTVERCCAFRAVLGVLVSLTLISALSRSRTKPVHHPKARPQEWPPQPISCGWARPQGASSLNNTSLGAPASPTDTANEYQCSFRGTMWDRLQDDLRGSGLDRAPHHLRRLDPKSTAAPIVFEPMSACRRGCVRPAPRYSEPCSIRGI